MRRFIAEVALCGGAFLLSAPARDKGQQVLYGLVVTLSWTKVDEKQTYFSGVIYPTKTPPIIPLC